MPVEFGIICTLLFLKEIVNVASCSNQHPPVMHVFCGFLVDIDECTNSEKKLCPQICHNTLGSYECDCFVGYSLKEDQTNCRGEDTMYSNMQKILCEC